MEESAVCRSLGEQGSRLLRFLVEQTLEGKAPQAKTIATLLDGVEEPDDAYLTQIRDRVSKLRKALSFYYDTHGTADIVVMSLPDNAKRDGYRVTPKFADRQVRAGSPDGMGLVIPAKPWIDTLSRSGLTNAFRIKEQNRERLHRVKDLIREEAKVKQPHFRLVASSGFSYLNRSMGPVWVEAGLGDIVYGRKARFDVVLESPFSDFAECRALANVDTRHHWDHKVNVRELEELQDQRPNLSIRVTEIPVNCSLFITSKSIFYDPYLWARPSGVHPTENNFWVFEFRRGEESYDCYELLTRHFSFVWENSVTLREFLRQEPSYERRTKLFEERVRTRIRQAKLRDRRA
ncbi:MAG TPA: hypothetical protein VGG72_02965 [Bryobacteraceae bacterium]